MFLQSSVSTSHFFIQLLLCILGRPTAVKLVDKDTLLKEREAKKKVEAERLAEKERKRKELEDAQALKEAQRRIPPQEIFKSETDKYSAFDDKASLSLKVSLD